MSFTLDIPKDVALKFVEDILYDLTPKELDDLFHRHISDFDYMKDNFKKVKGLFTK